MQGERLLVKVWSSDEFWSSNRSLCFTYGRLSQATSVCSEDKVDYLRT